ncbi:MAG: hypothetical protein AB1659_02175 [Thermodesulfobacteriota bacterium]
MSFKENLLKKIEIDHLAQKVIDSIGPSGSDRKADRETMRQLLQMGPYEIQKHRDLELFLLELDGTGKKILVLDNELPIYSTKVEDVVLRKSPTLKEMLSIRNAVKILNDKDVKRWTKEDSVRKVWASLIRRIDLAFIDSDIEEIESDGTASLARGYMAGVVQALTLFAELLEYSPAPKPLDVSQCHVFGRQVQKSNGEKALMPVLIYNRMHNSLTLMEGPVGVSDKERIEEMHLIASGKKKGLKEGTEVFTMLKEMVIQEKMEWKKRVWSRIGEPMDEPGHGR